MTMLQTSDLAVIVLGKREDGTFDGEIEFKATGGVRFNVPYYVLKDEDFNPKRRTG